MTETITPTEVVPNDNNNGSNGDMDFDRQTSTAFATVRDTRNFDETPTSINIAIDAGASETRYVPMGREDKINSKSIRSVPSPYAIVDIDEDLSIYKISSNDIEDNAEYIIKENEDSAYLSHSWFAEPTKIIKGTLITKMGKAPSSIDNQKDKSNDIGIFINTLTAIANLGLEKGSKFVSAKIAMSIPPKERYASVERLEDLRYKLAGTYTIEMPRYGYTVTIEIGATDKDIIVEAEGELPYIYYVTVGKKARERYEELKEQIVTIQDLGSSTFNLSLVRDGGIQSGVSHTAKYGGENLISKLYSILARSLNQPVTFEQAREAVQTGYIKSGTKKVPVGIQLTRAKSEVAEILYKEYVTFLQISGLHSSSIYAHIFVGRGMLETGKIEDGKADEYYSPSIAHILSEKYKTMSEDTKSLIVANPGMANLLGLVSLMRTEWKV